MTVPQLRERVRQWLGGEYRSVIFSVEEKPVAYALYNESADEVYLRQLFVERGQRRRGIGRHAISILREQVWSKNKRLTVSVLTTNSPAVAFWRSVGYQEYALTLEIMPQDAGD